MEQQPQSFVLVLPHWSLCGFVGGWTLSSSVVLFKFITPRPIRKMHGGGCEQRRVSCMLMSRFQANVYCMVKCSILYYQGCKQTLVLWAPSLTADRESAPHPLNWEPLNSLVQRWINYYKVVLYLSSRSPLRFYSVRMLRINAPVSHWTPSQLHSQHLSANSQWTYQYTPMHTHRHTHAHTASSLIHTFLI